MPKFSKESLKQLSACNHKLQMLLNEAIKHIDFIVVCGHRNKEDQHKAFVENKSKVDWPNSFHNFMPSEAVDIEPYPIDYKDIWKRSYLQGYIKAIADSLGIEIEQGCLWKQFRDEPHIQLKGAKQ
jgi:peptidoglycan L-alanyl-D-glutamate endopeptidase CwlK